MSPKNVAKSTAPNELSNDGIVGRGSCEFGKGLAVVFKEVDIVSSRAKRVYPCKSYISAPQILLVSCTEDGGVDLVPGMGGRRERVFSMEMWAVTIPSAQHGTYVARVTASFVVCQR